MTSQNNEINHLRTVGLLVVAIVVAGAGLTVLTGSVAADSPDCGTVTYNGSGTTDDPYQVGTVDQLQCIGSSTSTSLSDSFVLTSDIDASGTSSWNGGSGFDPIGANNPFTGTFDGQGKEIEGLVIDRASESSIGLFGETGSGATITNVGLVDVNITGDFEVGGLVGKNVVEEFEGNPATVKKSYVTGNVSGDENVGGLVGGNVFIVEQSYATADISGSSGDIGGLVGDNDGKVKQSYATGDVSGSSNVGGLIGSNSGTVEQSYWDTESTGQTGSAGGTGLTTADMTGANATDTMAGFAFTETWHATSLYPALAWQDTDPFYGVSIQNTNTPVTGGETLGVTADVTNWAAAGSQQSITLTDTGFNNTQQDSQLVDLTSGESETIQLAWDTTADDAGSGDVTVASENDTDSQQVTVALYAGGDGSASNPYEIADWTHLNNTRENLGANFTLVNDLTPSTTGYNEVANETANGGNGFEPIGDSDAEFTGTFNGSNHTISDLFINRSSNNVGLFGEVGIGGTVENVGVENADITGDKYVGGLVGFNFGGEVTESYATGDVSGSSDMVGGLVGQSVAGDIISSYATADVNGTNNVGGLLGRIDVGGTVSESYATGNISGVGDVGGLVGDKESEDETVSDSYWDKGTTNQSDAIGNTSGTNLTGFGDTDDTDPAPDTQGLNATVEMHRLDFDSTWRPSDGDYPDLAWDSEFSDNTEALDALVAGNGEDNPYEITTVYELQSARYNLSANYTLANDIDASATEEWYNDSGDPNGFDPVGVDFENAFTGTFDGDSHTITGLEIDRGSEDYVGLFGYLRESGSVIRNVTLEDAAVTGNEYVGSLAGMTWSGDGIHSVSVNVSVEGSRHVGGVVGFGRAGGGVVDASAEGTVSTTTGIEGIGGVVGSTNSGGVTDSTADVDVNAADADKVGGLVGQNYMINIGIEGSSATGAVQGNNDVGGLAGYNTEPVKDSYATGNVTGAGTNVSGLVGRNEGTISQTYAAGDIDGDIAVGGLVGNNTGTVTESYATGEVTGSDDVGGVVGFNTIKGNVTNSYATSDVTGTNDFPDVGGLVGVNSGNVTKTYATGNVSGSGSDVAGLAGANSGEVTDGYWDVGTTGQSSSAGSPDENGLTTAEMQRFDPLVTMQGLSFESPATWTTVDGYPALSWQAVEEITVASVEGSDVATTVGKQAQLTVTASDGQSAAERVAVEVLDSDGLDGITAGDIVLTDNNGEATFSVSQDTEGTYSPVFAWANDTSVSDTVTVTVGQDATFRRTDLAVEPSSIEPGGTVTVSLDIKNVGDDSGYYGIAIEVDGEREFVEVRQSLEPGEQVRDSVELTLKEPGEREVRVVGMTDQPTSQTVTVEQPAADVEITGYDLNETEITAGGSVRVDAAVENTGGQAGKVAVPLVVENETVLTEKAEVDANTTRTVTFVWTFEEAGKFDVGVGERPPTTVTVTELASPDISITGYNLSATTLQVNETLIVNATLTNEGAATGEINVPLLIENETVLTEPVEVGANSTKTVTFEWSFETSGNVSVTVSSLEETPVTVGTAYFEVQNITVDAVVVAGQSTSVNATVQNTGLVGDQQSVELVVESPLVAYTGENNTLETSELRRVIDDWRRGNLSTALLREAITAWRTGDPVKNESIDKQRLTLDSGKSDTVSFTYPVPGVEIDQLLVSIQTNDSTITTPVAVRTE